MFGTPDPLETLQALARAILGEQASARRPRRPDDCTDLGGPGRLRSEDLSRQGQRSRPRPLRERAAAGALGSRARSTAPAVTYSAGPMNWLLLLKSLHVLAAITAIGANLTYAVWELRAGRDREQLRFALRGITFLDQRVANPAYGVVLITGLIMVFTQPGLSITLTWVLIGLVIFVVVGALGGALYAPWLRQQMAALESSGPDSTEYSRAAARTRALGLFLIVLVFAIVVDMVVQPLA